MLFFLAIIQMDQLFAQILRTFYNSIFNYIDSKQMLLQFTDNQIDDLMIKLEFNPELRKGKEDFLAEFNRFYLTVKEFLKGFQSNVDDQDQILHHLHIFVRKEAEKIQEKFESTYGPIMEQIHQKKNDPVEAYYFHTVLKYSIRNQVQELIELIDNKMIFPENHPFRALRKCPHCGLIWLKVLGCDNVTCGTRVEEQEEVQFQQSKKSQAVEKKYEFTFNRKNGTLAYKECKNIQNSKIQTFYELGKLTQRHPLFNHRQRDIPIIVPSRKIVFGCRNDFKWNEASILRLSELNSFYNFIIYFLIKFSIFNQSEVGFTINFLRLLYLSNKDQLYKNEYEAVRCQLIDQVLSQKKRL